jgi:diadenosine tetraphosphatase ApaH/serine/threonine PP2A family protein phosphatase
MRVAVISDIHANLQALDAVLVALSPFDRLWVLGDTVGYGGDPDGVVERLREHDAVAVQGNHDAAVLGRISHLDFNDAARAAVAWTTDAIAGETRSWLAGLPDRRVEGDFTLVHGSPRDPLWEYLLSVPAARLALAAYETPYCLVGHTHLPLVFRDEQGQVRALPAADGVHMRLDQRRVILNPGSVGQPRDGDPRACGLLLDTEARTADWRRVPYPIVEAQAAIRARGLPAHLADRLAEGR